MSVNLVNQTDASLAPIAGATLYADAPVGSIQAYGGATAPFGWLLCQGQAVSRATYAELFGVIGTSFGAGDGSTTFNVPDLRGRFAEGLASGDTLGARKNAGLPNIKGQITGGALCSQTGASGAISAATVTSAKYNESGTFMRYSLTFNAHNSNSIYSDDVSTVQPPAVCVNYIIKATTISLPSDFGAAVDEKIDDALERKYVVAAGTYASGLLLEKSGHVVCAEFDGLSAAAIIEGTIPEGYRPVRNVLTMGVIVADGKSYSCWVWFFTNGTIAGAYAPENASPVDFTSARTSWSVHGSASWIVS